MTLISEGLANNPRLASQLAQEEARAKSQDPGAAPIDVNKVALATLQAEVESLKRERDLAKAKAQEAEARQLLLSRCVPTIIGGDDGYDPRTLDVQITDEPVSPNSMSPQRLVQVAWIPVLLYPIRKHAEGKDGKPSYWNQFDRNTGEVRKLPNWEVGRTTIIDSRARARVVTGFAKDGTPITEEVSLKGIAILNASHVSPEDTDARIERRERRGNWDKTTTDAHAHKPPFIPSLAGDRRNEPDFIQDPGPSRD